MAQKYKTLDIQMLYVKPEMRGIAMQIVPQMGPLSPWEKAWYWIRELLER